MQNKPLRPLIESIFVFDRKYVLAEISGPRKLFEENLIGMLYCHAD